MKAVVIHAARDLRVEEREPEAAGAGQVEIAVEAGGICGSDLHYFNHGGFGTVRGVPRCPRSSCDYCASCANPFQSKVMPWPGRVGANAMPWSSTSGCAI